MSGIIGFRKRQTLHLAAFSYVQHELAALCSLCFEDLMHRVARGDAAGRASATARAAMQVRSFLLIVSMANLHLWTESCND